MDTNSPPPQQEQSFVKKNIATPLPTAPVAAVGVFKEFYRANKIYFWAIIAAVVIISFLGFFAFRKTPAVAPTQAKVKISFDAPDTAAIGADMVYKIQIENQDSQKLVGVQLELAYPDGFSYESSSPNASNLSGSLFPVPDLSPGQNVVVIVKAKTSGSINDTKTIKAIAHYHYSNFNSEFTAEQDFATRLTASDVSVNIQGSTTTNNAQLVTYTITYQNNSQSDIKNAQIVFNSPDGFSISSSNPTADLSNNTWVVPSLAQGGTGSIEIRGTFNSVNPGESRTASADFLVLGTNGQYFTQSSSSFITSIASVPLLVTQSLEQDNSAGVVNPGDTLNITVKYQNNDSAPATGVNIVVSLNSSALDLTSIQAQGGQVNSSTITWNASSNSALETLTPSESGSVGFSVKVKNPATKDSSTNLKIVSGVKISSNEYQNPFSGDDLTLKISSPSTLTTSLQYQSGALPPQVGKPTTYRVTLTLRNSTNNFNNAVLSAFIPLGPGGFTPTSVNAAETGKVDYDPSTGKLTWNIVNLPAHTGQFLQPRVLQFNVTLNPAASQVSQSPALVTNIQMSATDSFTEQAVQNQADDITIRDIPGNDFNNSVVNP